MLREGRVPAPEKITSSMPDARMFLYELSPITQRNASTRFDLPQPLGPTTPVKPGSILNSVGSQKLLKPARRSRSNFMGLALLIVPSAGAEPMAGEPGLPSPQPPRFLRQAATKRRAIKPRGRETCAKPAYFDRRRKRFVEFGERRFAAQLVVR